jgi:DNA-binding transcriptional LysR family regulator
LHIIAAMNFRTLDLNLLKVFDALMAHGSLTSASHVLAITQPAASHALKRLNQSLGEPLFIRNARGMTPTPKAEALWPQVRAALAALHQALAPGVFDARSQSATFRLAMTDGGAALLAPALVRAIEAEQALCNLRVLPLNTHDPRGVLQQGGAELAVGHFPQAVAAVLAAGGDSPIRQRRLFDTDQVCAMRRGHPLAAKAPLTLDDYCAAWHLQASTTGRPQGEVDQALAALGRQRRVVLSVNQYFSAGRVLAESDLLAVLPRAFLAATGHEDRLLVRDTPFVLGTIALTMLWHLRHDAEPAHRWLREQVLGAVTSAPRRGSPDAPPPAQSTSWPNTD